jgi:hypothetical protein
MTGFIAKPSGDERTTAAPGLHRALATGAKNGWHPITKSLSENGIKGLSIAVHFRQGSEVPIMPTTSKRTFN